MISEELNGDKYVAFLCKFGCFFVETKVLASDPNNKSAFKHIVAKEIDYSFKLAGIESDIFSGFNEITPKNIEKIIKSPATEEETLIAFKLSNEQVLRVTNNHGMVLYDGSVVSSQKVMKGDFFIGYNGEPIEILDVSNFEQNQGVINFRLSGVKANDHIMGAEGVLVGDHAWQDDMEDDLNSIAIRTVALASD